ncbi:MAG: ribosome small subunit-dependent GTPase A [Negativicutes bacterium]|nr:ribosome small subunit-dependent GTPase A [Negativicutes bacterium]
MLRGIVIKAYNSYYYAQSGEKTFMCTLRGRFKKERFMLYVGDEVEFSLVADDKGVIEKILPRRSLLRRPQVANVDQVVLTFAAANPDINPVLIDRFLVLAELSRLKAIVCINKIDLVDYAELLPLLDLYRQVGYEVVPVAAKHGIGIKDLRAHLYGAITVFAGPSGAGKSTILNAIEPGLELATGEVSEKIGRGKHTTRYAQLLALSGGGFVVDTPGFSFTEFLDIEEAELAACFREFAEFAGECRFTSCLHAREPQCGIKQAVADKRIAAGRYQSYITLLTELRENKKGF